MAQPSRARSLCTSVFLGGGLVLLDAAPAAAHGAGGGSGAGGGDRRALVVGLAFAAFAVLAGPAVSPRPTRGRVLWRPIAAALVLVFVTSGGSASVDLRDRALGAAHVLAAAAWLGLVLDLAVQWHRDPVRGRELLHRGSTRALALLVVAGTTGTAIASQHLGDARLALGSWWGRGLAAKVALVVTAAVIGALLRRRWAPKLESGLLVGAASIGLVLALAGGPLSGALPTGPLLATAGTADVLVVPLAPGPNTVLVRSAGRPASGVVEVDGDRLVLEERGDGLWAAEVDLPEGRHRIDVGGRSSGVTIRPAEGATVVTATLPDRVADPDCLDRIAGYSAAADRLTSQGRTVRLQVRTGGIRCALDGTGGSVVDWATAGRSAVDALQARRGGGPVLVVVDGDRRADALVTSLRSGGPVRVVDPDDPSVADPGPTDLVVVATTPVAAAATALAAVTGGGGVIPVLLAPWLLDGAVLAELADVQAPILVGARRDPTAADAVDYRGALVRVTGGGWDATAAGLEGYLAALEALAGVRAGDAAPGVFSAGRLAILPPSLEQGHASESGWAPGLAMARVA